jgi:pimeloyl-ACP methyl ester carboxylesterase
VTAIAEIARPMLGGIPQWTMIRGRDTALPILVVLHGGPGGPETALFRRFNRALEDSFVVVHWEQRGAGKSFARDIPPQSMTVNRFLCDLDELIDYVRGRLGAMRKVVLLGHSWGSALGTLYAARHPEKVLAYVGTGQIGDIAASERASYAFVLAEAERRSNKRALAALAEIGPPPYGPAKIRVQRRWLRHFTGRLGQLSVPRFFWLMLTAPESSVFDLLDFTRGMRFTLRTMLKEVGAINLETTVPELRMPVWFLSGRHDHQVDAIVAEAYFDKLVAPAGKELVWFEESGHFVPFEEPEKFNRTMARIAAAVTPLPGR